MRNRPDAVELIETAEKTLTGDVAPDLSPRKRYSVALIAAALGIAKRELRGGPTAWPGEMGALRELYGTADGPADHAAALSTLNRRFAADLRAGLYDEPGRGRKLAMTLLGNDVVARLTEDNPRYEK
tara:strand:+ start:226 stop:606 length:381 start_codon:yes stop_codon:yes gene_type:complete